MNDEETNKQEEKSEISPENTNRASTLLENAKDVVERQEKANKETKKILERQEYLAANEMLGGTTGGRVEGQALSPEEQKVKGTIDYFKGTGLESTVKKANE